jgi:hypothetical protein
MKFGTVINCIDGRVQIPVLEYLKKHFDADFYDACNEAGPVKILSERDDTCRMVALKEQIRISMEGHGSRIIALVGHYDCAGNPVGRDRQEEQMKNALFYLQRAYGDGMIYLGLYVNENWKVEEVCRLE